MRRSTSPPAGGRGAIAWHQITPEPSAQETGGEVPAKRRENLCRSMREAKQRLGGVDHVAGDRQ